VCFVVGGGGGGGGSQNGLRDAWYCVVCGHCVTYIADSIIAWGYIGKWERISLVCRGPTGAFEEAYGIMFVQFEASLLLSGKLRQHIAPKHC